MSDAGDWPAFYSMLFGDDRAHVLTTAGLNRNGDWTNPYDQLFQSADTIRAAVEAANRNGRHSHVMLGSVDSTATGRVARRDFSTADVRCLAFDFDVHHDAAKERKQTDYGSEQELATALTSAFQQGMPHPHFVVQSGSGGVHLWYFIDRRLHHKGAERLRTAVLNKITGYGLRLDVKAGSKPNTSLRAPGSLNTKPHINAPVRTRQLKKAPAPLRKFLREWGLSLRDTAIPAEPAESSNSSDKTLPADITYRAISHCKHIAYQLKYGGKDLTRHQWMAVSGCLRSFEQPVQDHWRRACQTHFDPPPTDYQMDTALSERGFKGPNTCAEMGGGPDNPLCADCTISPSRSGGLYPLFHMTLSHERTMEQERAVQLAEIGKPLLASDLRRYETNAVGEVTYQGGNEQDVVICQPEFGIQQRVQADKITYYEVMNVNKPSKVNRFPPEAKNNLGKLADALSKIDISVRNRNAVLRLYQEMTDQVHNEVEERRSIGWVTPEEFAAPTMVVTPTGLRRSSMALPPINGKELGAEGTTDDWYRAMRPIFELRYPRSELYLFSTLLGLSSILPAYLDIDKRPALCSFYNPQSGTGKTTMLKLGNSWFMKFCETSVGFDDTDANAMSIIGSMKHLYCNIDELTTKVKADPIAISKMVRQLLTGIERGRMAADGAQWERSDWLCQVSVSTNESLFEISGDAGLSARIMEFSVSNEDKPLPLHVFQALEDVLDKNYGVAGIHMVQTLLAGGKQVRREVRTEYEREGKMISKHLNKDVRDGTGRFRINLMTCVMTAAHLVNRYGKVAIPLQEFRAWCVDQLHNAADKQFNIMQTSQYTFDHFYNDILRLGCVRKGDTGHELSGLDTVGRAPPFYCFKLNDHLYIRREDIQLYLSRTMRSRGTLDQWIADEVLDGTEEEHVFTQGDETLAAAKYLVIPYQNISSLDDSVYES